MTSVLVVEDEVKIAELHRDFLIQAGFDVHMIHDGSQVLTWLQSHQAHIIVLDVMLPGKDGMSLCRDIREFSQVPIIMVTARVNEMDRINGLDLGADDYVCKPVSPKELVARVKAQVRRTQFQQSDQDNTTHSSASCSIDISASKYQATLLGHPLDLTAIEFQLLATLVNNPGQIFSREQIMQHIYSDSRIVSDRTIDSHIKKIRKKLAAIDATHSYIHTLYSVGFKFEQEKIT